MSEVAEDAPAGFSAVMTHKQIMALQHKGVMPK